MERIENVFPPPNIENNSKPMISYESSSEDPNNKNQSFKSILLMKLHKKTKKQEGKKNDPEWFEKNNKQQTSDINSSPIQEASPEFEAQAQREMQNERIIRQQAFKNRIIHTDEISQIELNKESKVKKTKRELNGRNLVQLSRE